MSVSGKYKLSMQTPMGPQTPTLTLNEEGGKVSGNMSGAGPMGTAEFQDGTADGNNITFEMKISAMGQEFSLSCKATIDGDNISGQMSTPMGGADFTGQREA